MSITTPSSPNKKIKCYILMYLEIDKESKNKETTYNPWPIIHGVYATSKGREVAFTRLLEKGIADIHHVYFLNKSLKGSQISHENKEEGWSIANINHS